MISIVCLHRVVMLMIVDDENFDAGNLPASQMRRELPDAFQPHMLASLETQCRDFMA